MINTLYERMTFDRNHNGEIKIPRESRSEPLVLLVEDDLVSSKIAIKYLENMGYKTIVASNGSEGLSLAREYLPDLILTDALMPKMDGREMCKVLKEDAATQGIKVLITTATYTKSKYKWEAIQVFKADGFLNKPLNFDELKLNVEQLIGRPADFVKQA